MENLREALGKEVSAAAISNRGTGAGAILHGGLGTAAGRGVINAALKRSKPDLFVEDSAEPGALLGRMLLAWY